MYGNLTFDFCYNFFLLLEIVLGKTKMAKDEVEMQTETRNKNELDDEELQRMLGVLDEKVCFYGECSRDLFDIDLNDEKDAMEDEKFRLEKWMENMPSFSTVSGHSFKEERSVEMHIDELRQFARKIAKSRGWIYTRKGFFVKEVEKRDEQYVQEIRYRRESIQDELEEEIHVHVEMEEIAPREWEHIPGRDVSAWDKLETDPHDLQLQFVEKLMQIQPGGLKYEPIDRNRFFQAICNYIEEMGVVFRYCISYLNYTTPR